MKRIFVDYTRIGHADDGRPFRTRLFGSERDALTSGATVIIEGDSVPDREATFVELLDEQTALFSFVPTSEATAAAVSSDPHRRP